MKRSKFVLALLLSAFMLGCSGGGSGGGVAAVTPTLGAFSGSVDNGSTPGTLVGTMAVDDGGSAVTAIVLSGTNASDFTVELNGTIRVSGSIDALTKPLYTLSAVASNAIGDSSAVNVTISINTVPTLSAFSGNVDDNSSGGTLVGKMSLTDGGRPVTAIVLSGTNASDFSADNNGTITVAAGVTLDYATQAGYTLQAVASNALGDSAAVDVNISVNDLSTATVATLGGFSTTLVENTLEGTFVGQLSVDDGGSVVTAITLSGGGEGNFTVETNGTVRVAVGAKLDFETQALYTLQAVASNGKGLSAPVDVNVSLTDLFDTTVKTGQTAIYAAFDDGAYQRGAARDYTRDDVNNTVTDNLTKLMWQDDAAVTTNQMDRAAANDYCNGLTLGAFSDWRLPSIKELEMIVDDGANAPALDTLVFQNSFNGFTWSSTPFTINVVYSWGVDFSTGSTRYLINTDLTTGFARCVRNLP